MKKIFVFGLLLIGGVLFAQDFSGVLDSTFNYTVTTDDPCHSFGVEEYANLRLRVRAGEKALFFSAFNIVVVSGNFFLINPLLYGENFGAALEVERLYFRINGNYFDTEAGLLRLNFGYSQVWGSSDFLNPINPFSMNARPRGVLGFSFVYYPVDTLKIQVFGAAPNDPFEAGGGGFMPGIAMDKHWDFASLQAIYSFETPLAGSAYGRHRFGLSVKADWELGFVADALYILNAENPDYIEGLSASAGFDYSFLGGDFYTLWEYLFNGEASSTSATGDGFLFNRHFLSGSLFYRINDYFRVGISSIYCFDDPSFLNSISLDYEVFQGLSLSLNARLPLNVRTSEGVNEGELGPDNTETRFSVNIGAKLRF